MGNIVEGDEQTNRDACIKKNLVSSQCKSFLEEQNIPFGAPKEDITLWKGGMSNYGWKSLKDLKIPDDAFVQLDGMNGWSLKADNRNHRVYYLVKDKKAYVSFFIKLTSYDFGTYASILSEPKEMEYEPDSDELPAEVNSLKRAQETSSDEESSPKRSKENSSEEEFIDEISSQKIAVE